MLGPWTSLWIERECYGVAGRSHLGHVCGFRNLPVPTQNSVPGRKSVPCVYPFELIHCHRTGALRGVALLIKFKKL